MPVPTQGTQLFFIDPLGSFPVVREVGCPTSIEGLSAPRDSVDVSCLSEQARRFISGLASPGAATIGINFDPSDDSHLALNALWKDGRNIQFAIGIADEVVPLGTPLSVPTLDSSAEAFDLPATRSFVLFEGSVMDVPLSFAQNAAITSGVSVQVSGFYDVIPKV